MRKQPFETMPDVMDAKQIAEALQISKTGVYNLLNSPRFSNPTNWLAQAGDKN